ncbi:MAG: DNA gyrase subunit B [Planctomycetes bacterium]|nr:DNA gyrase subunit B [Planctomycetota bacterium]
MTEQQYDASQIKLLEGIEAIRKRPGMFIGDTGPKGLHQLVYEAVDNAVDEFMAGFAKSIAVTIESDGTCVVSDDGRGIPVDVHEQTKIPAVQVVLTKLHSGAKFDNNTYKVSAGLHGVGITATNALSEALEVIIKRNSSIYSQKYRKGSAITELKSQASNDSSNGTTIRFKPDHEIFPDTNFQYDTLTKRFRELAYLNKGLIISFEDKRSNKKEKFHYEGGLEEFVLYLTKSKKLLTPVVSMQSTQNDTVIEGSFAYVDKYDESIFSFVNCVNTRDGGTHVSGFRSALTRTLNQIGKDKGVIKQNEDALSGEDYKEGLVLVLSLRVKNPLFESQTKVKLTNPEIEGATSSVVQDHLKRYFEKDVKTLRVIIERARLARQAREASKSVRELIYRKTPLASGDLPTKLADCSSRKIEETELFIVEGESAGGSAKQARDRNFQAILPLKGKILNVEKARLNKILENDEIRTLISSVGIEPGENADIGKLRYGRVIILADSDIDGSHIRTLLLTFFYRYMKTLVENARVFIAMAPLFNIKHGKENLYAFDDKELQKALKSLRDKGVQDNKIEVTRFKGLGEMNPEQLWETTLNPKTRRMKLINLSDAKEADDMFSILMGDEVPPRRKFIEENAKFATNIDA